MRKRLSVAMLGLALISTGITACDSGDRVSGPASERITPVERTATPPARYIGTGWGAVLQLISTTNWSESKINAAVIGSTGGRVVIGSNVLTVPANAVTEPTLFVFTLVGGEHVRVSLLAVRLRDGQQVTQFSNPVNLKLSYYGLGVTDPSRLLIAWLVNGTLDGVAEPMPSTVDSVEQTVSANLPHFSEFVMAVN